MCSVMIAIEYSYKLDTKNDFNLWCELRRPVFAQTVTYAHKLFTIHMVDNISIYV